MPAKWQRVPARGSAEASRYGNVAEAAKVGLPRDQGEGCDFAASSRVASARQEDLLGGTARRVKEAVAKKGGAGS